MLSLNKNLIPHPLAILIFIESLFNFSLITSDGLVNTDSWLYGKSSKDPSSEKPFIYKPIADREMEKKREKLLTDDERTDELYGTAYEPYGRYGPSTEVKKINDQIDKEYNELIVEHDRNIKERTGWDPKGHLKDQGVTTAKRNEVRDPNFLDDDKSTLGSTVDTKSVLGSINEDQDKGRLGDLSVINKSGTSINTQQSDDTIKPEASGDKNSDSSKWADFIDSLFN